MIVRDALDNGIRLVTESMSHVRSVSLGVWLSRGSRHETDEESGIAHFVEHMLFKGTATRTAEEIAQAVDSIGGQLDAFTAKEYASYYVKVWTTPALAATSSDIVFGRHSRNPSNGKKGDLEEIKMVGIPHDLVHEFYAAFWEGTPSGPIPEQGSVERSPSAAARSFSRRVCRRERYYFCSGNSSFHSSRSAREAFRSCRLQAIGRTAPPRVVPK